MYAGKATAAGSTVSARSAPFVNNNNANNNGLNTAHNTEVLCCCVCTQMFCAIPMTREPVSLACGHVMCRLCLGQMKPKSCPLDAVAITCQTLPTNVCLLRILQQQTPAPMMSPNGCLTVMIGGERAELGVPESGIMSYRRCVQHLLHLSFYLHRPQTERGASVWSNEVSRSCVRKLVYLMCYQLVEYEGRQRCVRACRLLAERCVNDMLVVQQSQSHVSSQLWTAVRARGCQFLGPAMQEEVLRLILLTLSEGALISRKNLVMYIVQTLEKDYPQASKTCVGHVVQLLYRASCFNVFKREAESSLMQLKAEYREYESLRREHDTQIVQIATESGLRISPDQWSSLLYADQAHRAHMQSIIDSLSTPASFAANINELLLHIQRAGDPDSITDVAADLQYLASLDAHTNSTNTPSDWQTCELAVASCHRVIDAQVRMSKRRKSVGRSMPLAARQAVVPGTSFVLTAQGPTAQFGATNSAKYKTSLCRELLAGRACPRGNYCTYAHSMPELHRYRARQQQTNGASVSPLLTNGLPAMGAGVVPIPPNGVVPVVAAPPGLMTQSALAALTGDSGSSNAMMPVFPIMQTSRDGSILVPPPTGRVAVNLDSPIQQQVFGAPTVTAIGQDVDQTQPGLAGPSTPSALLGTEFVMSSSVFSVVPSDGDRPKSTYMNSGDPSENAFRLQQKREEILRRLNELQSRQTPVTYTMSQEDTEHVSYAVASSVFDEDPGWRALRDNLAAEHARATEEYSPWNSINPTSSLLSIWKSSSPNNLVTEVVPKDVWSTPVSGVEEEKSELTMPMPDASAANVSTVCTVLSSATYPTSFSAYMSSIPDDVNVLMTRGRESPSRSLSAYLGELPPLPYSAIPLHQKHMGAMSCAGSSTMPCTVLAASRINNMGTEIKDVITHPISTPTVVASKPGPILNPDGTSHLYVNIPKVMRNDAGTMFKPRPNDIGLQIDRILQCKETINASDRQAPPCAVEKQQLRIELKIINKQLESMDRHTEVKSLMQELEAINQNLDSIAIDG